MKIINKVEIEFADVALPVAQDSDGRDVVPLKPISDAFGLDWERQRVKAQTPYLSSLLGTCTQQMLGAGQRREMVCIRLDRVAAWLFRVNPESVRAVGNEAGADFLIQKHEEWADLIHEYETRKGGMLKVSADKRAANLRLFISAINAQQRANSAPAKKALGVAIGQIAGQAAVRH